MGESDYELHDTIRVATCNPVQIADWASHCATTSLKQPARQLGTGQPAALPFQHYNGPRTTVSMPLQYDRPQGTVHVLLMCRLHPRNAT